MLKSAQVREQIKDISQNIAEEAETVASKQAMGTLNKGPTRKLNLEIGLPNKFVVP